MLPALELHPWPGDQRNRWTVHRNDHLILPLAAAAALLIAALAGCGEDPSPATSTTTGETTAEEDPVLVAALGDSITAGNPLYDPDPAARVRLGFGEDERSQYEYWATESEPGYLFTNCGVFGERTDEIAARLDQCSDGADVLLIQGGINDIAQGIPVETASENLRAMVQAGKQAGQTVVLVDILPWNNGHPGADAPIAELNEEIARIAAEEKVKLLRFHDALEDPGEPGVMASGLTDDGDHPSIEGYRRLGELFPPPEELLGSG